MKRCHDHATAGRAGSGGDGTASGASQGEAAFQLGEGGCAQPPEWGVVLTKGQEGPMFPLNALTLESKVPSTAGPLRQAEHTLIELKIELIGIKPPIWRRVLVPNDISLDILHFVLQGAMPWQDCHLHEFEISEDRFEARDERDDSWDPTDGRKDEKMFTLGKLVKKGSQFTYTYDFGDGWRHLVTVEKISKPTGRPDLDFPACVAGARACPPEDCGGPYSYEEFLDALTDKHHPEHRGTKQWAGAFEPEVFSVQQANAAVGAMFVWAKERHNRK